MPRTCSNKKKKLPYTCGLERFYVTVNLSGGDQRGLEPAGRLGARPAAATSVNGAFRPSVNGVVCPAVNVVF